MFEAAPDLLALIRKQEALLSAAERRVGAVVLADPEAATRGTLANLASRAGVSDPTVLRFCRTLGLPGFRDLQVGLARTTAAAASGIGPMGRVDPADDVATATAKVFNLTIQALQATQRALSAEPIERAALALLGARRIAVYGIGASAITAADAQHKLFRLTGVAIAHADSHMQVMSAATLAPGDAALAISRTGRTRELLQTVEIAHDAGATVVAITAAGSPLAGLANIVLAVDIDEETALFTPMVSRTVHLAVVDALTVAIALHAPPASAERLGRMRDALDSRRIPPAVRTRRRSTPQGD